MSKPRLAVDFDGVLANTYAMAFELMCGPGHGYTVDDVESWTWGFDEFGKERYLSALWHAWTLRPTEVPPMEEHLPQKMAALHREYEVHIVTAHPDHLGITEGKQRWLDYHVIPREEFHVVPPRTTKADLEYDAYIDDKPTLPANASDDQTVYVRDQPWNHDVDAEHIRVNSITDVLTKEIAIY